jgi:hypothetical protein
MSTPISPIRSLGRPDAEAGDAVELGDLPLVRLAQDGDPLVQHADLGGELVDVVQHHLQDEGVVGGEERAVQGLPQLGDLPPHPGPRLLREGFGVALAGDDGAQHVAAGDAMDVADHARQLQVRVLQQLLAALLLRGAHLDQLAAVAGVRAQPADLLRRHEGPGQ